MKALPPHHHCVIRHEANASVILQQVQFKPAIYDLELINNKRTIYTQLVLQTTKNQYVHRTCMQQSARPRVTICSTNQRTSRRTSSLWSSLWSTLKPKQILTRTSSSAIRRRLPTERDRASVHEVVAEKLLELSSIVNNQYCQWQSSPTSVTAEVFNNVKVVKWSAVHCV